MNKFRNYAVTKFGNRGVNSFLINAQQTTMQLVFQAYLKNYLAENEIDLERIFTTLINRKQRKIFKLIIYKVYRLNKKFNFIHF